jgi:hypothetical protein
MSARMFAGADIALRAMIFDYTGKALYNSK